MMQKIPLLVVALFIVAGNIAAVPKENLARVAILDFTDRTESPDYQYLSSSLSLGVDKSMKSRFDYNPIAPEATRQQIADLFKDGKLDKENAKKAAALTNADIVIGGSYKLLKEENKMQIRVVIYLTEADQFIALPDFQNPVDGTIFQAIDKVSEKIVIKIKEIASRQRDDKDGGDNAKMAITRKLVTSWRDKSEEIAFFFYTLKDFKNVLGNDGSGGVAGVLFRSNFSSVPWLHWGLSGSILYYGASATASTTVSGTTLTSSTTNFVLGTIFEGIIGTHFVLSDRFKLYYELGPGYTPAFSVLNSNLKSVSDFSLTNKLGLEFLIGKIFTLEVFGSYTYFSGLATSFIGGGVALTFAH